MAYPDDLLELAQEIANLHPGEAQQPSLRRALSTAYYALFHLLISEAVANCSESEFRAALARMNAFKSWKLIRGQPEARTYLISLLPSKERRQNEKPRSDKRPTLTDDPKS